jgi:prevent-host-death family protein
MKSAISVTDARRNFGKLLDRVERGERIVITRYGKPFVALIPISDFELLAQTKARRQRMASDR